MAEAGKAPVRDSVGAALASVRANLPFVGATAVFGALALTLITGLTLAVPFVGVFGLVGGTVLRAFVYAAFIAMALSGAASVRGRLARDGWRVWGAMTVVGFFMFIVMFVLMIPGSIALFAGPMAPYVGDLERAGADQAAMLEITTRFVQEQPGVVFGYVLFYGLVWLLLTSRLYLAAPASADQGRILTFETWRWTKGSMLRITGARLMLLGPAYVLVSALDYIVARLFSINPIDPSAAAAMAQTNPLGLLLYVFATSLITLAVYSSLEAGLSTYLYRGLKPPPGGA